MEKTLVGLSKENMKTIKIKYIIKDRSSDLILKINSVAELYSKENYDKLYIHSLKDPKTGEIYTKGIKNGKALLYGPNGAEHYIIKEVIDVKE